MGSDMKSLREGGRDNTRDELEKRGEVTEKEVGAGKRRG